jgi:hypothetical protein
LDSVRIARIPAPSKFYIPGIAVVLQCGVILNVGAHLRGAHMATTFFLPYVVSGCERRRHLRGAHMAATFCLFTINESIWRIVEIERRHHLRVAHMAATLIVFIFLYLLIQIRQTEENVGAMCAPRRWRQRSDANSNSSFCNICVYFGIKRITIGTSERRRHRSDANTN